MIKSYMKGIVRLGGKGRQGIGLELFRADAIEDEDVDLTESEEESIGEASESVAVMRIYENIGADFFSGKGITAKSFAKELSGLGNIKQLNIHINCLGGDVFTAQAIHNIIRDHGADRKAAYIDGVCASAATVIACGANEVIARNNSMYMIHLPWAMCIGNSAEMRKAADQLDTLTSPIVSVYKSQVKGKIREAKIRALMEAETWMTSDEALDYGFVDKVKGEIKAIAKVSNSSIMSNGQIMNVAKYHYLNVPEYPVVKMEVVEVAEKEEKQMVEITREMLEKDYDEIVASIRMDACKAERLRLVALDQMKPEDCPEEMETLIEAAKLDGRQPHEIAMECFNISKQQMKRDDKMEALRRDGDMHVKAGSAPSMDVSNKGDRAVQLLTKAFQNQNGRKQ